MKINEIIKRIFLGVWMLNVSLSTILSIIAFESSYNGEGKAWLVSALFAFSNLLYHIKSIKDDH